MGTLQPLPVLGRSCSHIAPDFVTGLPLLKRNTIILDRFVKAAHLFALPKLPTTLETTTFLFSHIISMHSSPMVRQRGPINSYSWPSSFCYRQTIFSEHTPPFGGLCTQLPPLLSYWPLPIWASPSHQPACSQEQKIMIPLVQEFIQQGQPTPPQVFCVHPARVELFPGFLPPYSLNPCNSFQANLCYLC